MSIYFSKNHCDQFQTFYVVNEHLSNLLDFSFFLILNKMVFIRLYLYISVLHTYTYTYAINIIKSCFQTRNKIIVICTCHFIIRSGHLYRFAGNVSNHKWTTKDEIRLQTENRVFVYFWVFILLPITRRLPS